MTGIFLSMTAHIPCLMQMLASNTIFLTYEEYKQFKTIELYSTKVETQFMTF